MQANIEFTSARSALRRWLLGALALGWCSSAALGQEVTLIVSAKTGERLTPQPAARFAARSGSEASAFRVDDKTTFQTIAGFGASFLEAGMVCLNTLPEAARERVLESPFSIRGAVRASPP